MTITELQKWLVAHGASIAVDGQPGPATRAAIMAVFANRAAPAVSAADITRFAAGIVIPERNLRAVAKVESGGSGFDDNGRPKNLFERHHFHRRTNGRFSVSAFSNPKAGGYAQNSWDKLCAAACKDPDAAFESASWGKFQIMGWHSGPLGYPSAIDFAYGMVQSEAAHYEALARFISVNGLADEARALSTNPETCRAFASRYNGSGYAAGGYHRKLAEAMR